MEQIKIVSVSEQTYFSQAEWTTAFSMACSYASPLPVLSFPKRGGILEQGIAKLKLGGDDKAWWRQFVKKT